MYRNPEARICGAWQPNGEGNCGGEFKGFEPLDMEEDWIAAMNWEFSWNGSVPEKNTQAFEHG